MVSVEGTCSYYIYFDDGVILCPISREISIHSYKKHIVFPIFKQEERPFYATLWV